MIKPYSAAIIGLNKGIVYNTSAEVWELLLRYEADLKNYFSESNLQIYLDRAEGFAYLRNEDETEANENLPRLIEKRPLSFPVSLLCLLLRKHLLEHDGQGDQVRAIVSGDELTSLMKPFLKSTNNEVRQDDQMSTTIKKVAEIGFLRRLKGEDELYEINRIIKGFIDESVISQTYQTYKNINAQDEEYGV